jgi:hypothetical protein
MCAWTRCKSEQSSQKRSNRWPTAQIVVNDLAEAESEVDADMDCGNNLQHRKVGDWRRREAPMTEPPVRSRRLSRQSPRESIAVLARVRLEY